MISPKCSRKKNVKWQNLRIAHCDLTKKVNVELAYNTLMPDSKIGHFTNLKVVKIAFQHPNSSDSQSFCNAHCTEYEAFRSNQNQIGTYSLVEVSWFCGQNWISAHILEQFNNHVYLVRKTCTGVLHSICIIMTAMQKIFHLCTIVAEQNLYLDVQA